MFGHVLYLTGNDRQWAEDVVQETLVRAWRNADRLDRESIGVRAWLYTVARNLVIDGRRSSKVRPHEVDAAPLETMTIPDDSENSLSAMVIADALQALSPKHREALAETYLRDRTIEEAARVLGVPQGTVKSRVYYALRALRHALEKDARFREVALARSEQGMCSQSATSFHVRADVGGTMSDHSRGVRHPVRSHRAACKGGRFGW